MGILGLKDCARRFLVPYDLKSTPLIVDGNAISITLTTLTKCDARFGGDYKELRENMFRFFSKLKEDDVTPIVILDGRFKDEKASTIKKRGKGTFDEAKRYNKNYNMHVNYPFYIFKTEILLQVLKSLDIFVCRADSEADEEIIALAGKLNIPVLSNDYDFCICENVTFIPWEDEIFYKGCFKKFDRETFIRVHSVSASVLPLVPVLVNDDHFQMNILGKLIGRKISPYMRCGFALEWLENKDFDTAKNDIITCLSMMNMSKMVPKVNFVIDSYKNPKVTLDSTFRKNATLKSRLADVQLDVQENDIVKKYGVPEKIAEIYREGGLPSLMLDMLTHHEFNARTIAIEDLEKPSIHSASKRLIQGICGLLFRDRDDIPQITLKIRKDRNIFEDSNIFEDRNSEMLDPLIFSNTIPLQILYEIMEIGEADQNILKFFDGDWLVFILSVIYWKRSCGVEATPAHFHFILSTAFYLNLMKDKNEFPDTNDDRKISKFFRNLKDGERRKYIDRMKSSQMKNYIIRMKCRRVFLTDISHIHMYLIFKKCLFYTIHILTLLGLPCQLKIEEFIDGELYNSFYKGENETPESDHFFFGFEHLENLLFFNHD